ncbi:MAG: pyroglutamyl-peptidase I, partial [Planctomycetota bacterium]
QSPDEFQPLDPAGPVAYRSDLPLVDWAHRLRAVGIPTTVSYHAGTYLCNAVLYWALHLANKWQLPTRSTFVHLPLATSQVVNDRRDTPSLPSEIAATALREILASIA